jgi:transcriptional regulator with GAF, ATPase, and Fis domain
MIGTAAAASAKLPARFAGDGRTLVAVTESELPAQLPVPAERTFCGLVGAGAAMQSLFEKIARYGPADAPVLVTGETGTGKELVARALHSVSARRARAFVALNCSALNEDLFESELFGHERGAFTGAVGAHRGRFERADGGTLFLDEIADMPMRVQAKFLRVLEDGVFERVGGEREIRGDARIVAATNAPLERAVVERRFREDLYHRVAVLRVHVPPLRERVEDLPLLCAHFLRIFADRYGRGSKRLSPEALRLLASYAWPGNVRELRNVLERVYVETTGDVISRGALNEWEIERDTLAAGAWNLGLREERRFVDGPIVVDGARDALPAPSRILDVPAQSIRHVRRRPKKLTADLVRDAFAKAEGNATYAAEMLGVHKTTLYRSMTRLGLSREALETKEAS